MILAGPRVYYAMAKDGIFFAKVGKVNRVRHTPAHAIGLQAAIAIVMIVSAAYDKLLIYIGFTLSLFAMLTVIGLMRLRLKNGSAASAYRTWGFPFTPLAFILGNLWIIYFSISSRPAPVLWGLATIAAGFGTYLYFSRSRTPRSADPRVKSRLFPDRGEIGSPTKEDLP